MIHEQPSKRNLRVLGLQIAVGLMVAAIATGYWSFSISRTTSSVQWWIGWLQDVGTEMLGAAVTILLVELVIYQKRDEASRLDRERMHRREQLADRLKHPAPLKSRQKVIDRMKKQNLLAGAWFYEVDLRGVDLSDTNLRDVDLFESQLEKANLQGAILEGAILHHVNLQSAVLTAVNLQRADLQGCDLRDANLTEANLQDAVVSDVQCNEQTILPDGSTWHPEMDWNQFTESTAANFWSATSRLSFL